MSFHSSKYAELTDEQFSLIGRIAVEWSNIEFLLGVLLSRLLFTPEFLGRVYADEMTASKTQSAICKALEIHQHRYNFQIISENTIKEISTLNKQIEKVRGVRNKFAHFCWFRSNDNEIFGTGFSGFLPSNKNHRKDCITLTLDELRKHHEEAYKLVEGLSNVIEKLSAIDEDTLKSLEEDNLSRIS